MASDTPSAYTAGTLSLAANTPYELGALVKQQLDPNAQEAAFLVTTEADATNTQPILFGMSKAVGTGSPVQYGRSLATGASHSFGGGTGNNILWGRWYVFSTAAALLHIEVMP